MDPAPQQVVARFRWREPSLTTSWRYLVCPDRDVFIAFLKVWAYELDVERLEVLAPPEHSDVLYWDTVHG